jgi:hypothetical protein
VRSLGPMGQYGAGPSYGIPQPRVSELGCGNVDRCSVEWLIRKIHVLGGSVTVTITLGDAGRAWQVSRFKAMRERRRARLDAGG